jgi:hypothetical protein
VVYFCRNRERHCPSRAHAAPQTGRGEQVSSTRGNTCGVVVCGAAFRCSARASGPTCRTVRPKGGGLAAIGSGSRMVRRGFRTPGLSDRRSKIKARGPHQWLQRASVVSGTRLPLRYFRRHRLWRSHNPFHRIQPPFQFQQFLLNFIHLHFQLSDPLRVMRDDLPVWLR